MVMVFRVCFWCFGKLAKREGEKVNGQRPDEWLSGGWDVFLKTQVV